MSDLLESMSAKGPSASASISGKSPVLLYMLQLNCIQPWCKCGKHQACFLSVFILGNVNFDNLHNNNDKALLLSNISVTA